MTGGQVAPTTFLNSITMTTPFGSKENTLDICQLAICAGATYVRRWTTTKPIQAVKSIKKALQHKGFSLVEIVSQCPTNFGRYALKTGDPEKVLQWIESKSLSLADANKKTEEELRDKFILGEFLERVKPVFQGTTLYKEEHN